MSLVSFISIFISSVFIYNVILSRFLGLCSFIAISKETKPAFAMSMAVMFVIVMSSIITWFIYRFLLVPFNLTYLRTISFILVIASFVQLVEMIVRKTSPQLYKIFGIYLPLITVNCAVFGTSILNIDTFFKDGRPITGSLILSIFNGFCVALGYTFAMLLMSGIRERLEVCDIPKSLKDFPLAFIIASIISMSFLGFSGFRF